MPNPKLLALPLWVAALLHSQTQPPRPPITGIAHFALKTSDLESARAFYGRTLGFAELFSIDNPDGGILLALFKVNDHQYLEVRPELKSETEDRLSHIAFETTDASQLRAYLAGKGIPVPPPLAPPPRRKPGLQGQRPGWPRY